MSSLIDTFSEGRKDLLARGTRIAAATRDHGLQALGKVRSGTLDWHRTLRSRLAHIDASGTQPRWLKLDGLQIFVIDRVDRALVAFADRVRTEIARLARLELGAPPKEAKKRAPAAERKKARAGAPKKAPAKRRAEPTRRLVMPIADYDDLTAKEVIAELGGLSRAQCKTVRAREASAKKRKTVLRALDARLA